jgi:hypothetical protein
MGAARIAISTRLSHWRAPQIALVSAFAMVGCKSTEPSEPLPSQHQPKHEPRMNERPLGGVAARPADPVPVKQGSLPLVYLAESTTTVRVVDQTTNYVLGETVLSPRTILRVDERNGVVAGKREIVAGPLLASHRYTIYVLPDDVNISRTGAFTPLPTKQPKTQQEQQ